MNEGHGTAARFVINLLTPVGRMRRLPFLLASVICIAAFIGSVMLERQIPDSVVRERFFSSLPGLAFWPLFSVTARRLHDFGWSGWVAAPQMVPLAVVIVEQALGGAMYATASWSHNHHWPTIYQILLWSMIASIFYILVATVVLAIVPGSKGGNRFGSPPGEPTIRTDVF